jgi:hypothetical protein
MLLIGKLSGVKLGTNEIDDAGASGATPASSTSLSLPQPAATTSTNHPPGFTALTLAYDFVRLDHCVRLEWP